MRHCELDHKDPEESLCEGDGIGVEHVVLAGRTVLGTKSPDKIYSYCSTCAKDLIPKHKRNGRVIAELHGDEELLVWEIMNR